MKLFLLLACVVDLFSAALRAQQTGFIQVSCEQGVQVFLDGKIQGRTDAASGGFIIEGVPAGPHTLKVLKPGFNPQEAQVVVAPGKVYEHRVRSFTQVLEVTQQGKSAQQQVVQKVGGLVIQTLPFACELSIESLGVKPGVTDKDGNEIARKTKDEWQANKVATGNHTATFRAFNKTFTHTFSIEEGQTTHLFVKIIAGTVRAVGAERRAAGVAATSPPDGGSAFTVPELGAEMLWIEAGTFRMGGDEGEYAAQPFTLVTLTRGFWLGTTEVTQAQWSAMMGNNPSHFRGDTLPVEQVTWDDALAFCRKLTERERAAGRLPEGHAYTLPTDAQWEYACRAGTATAYAGDVAAMAWHNQNADGTTHAVATKQANAWGLHDMHGNVWEWCLDWWSQRLPGGSMSDPVGPVSGSSRVLRGGGWANSGAFCRSANRDGVSPGGRGDFLGFRLPLSAVG